MKLNGRSALVYDDATDRRAHNTLQQNYRCLSCSNCRRAGGRPSPRPATLFSLVFCHQSKTRQLAMTTHWLRRPQRLISVHQYCVYTTFPKMMPKCRVRRMSSEFSIILAMPHSYYLARVLTVNNKYPGFWHWLSSGIYSGHSVKYVSRGKDSLVAGAEMWNVKLIKLIKFIE